MSRAPSFALENVGPGPDTLSLVDLAGEHAFVLVLLQRDHYCTNCREQVQRIADRYREFTARDTEVVSIVPEPRETVVEWQDSYDLPFPLLADPETIAGEAYDQPVRFGFLGEWSDFLGRMPEVVLIDCRGTGPDVAWTYAGRSTFDRPDVDDLLEAIDDRRGGDRSETESTG